MKIVCYQGTDFDCTQQSQYEIHFHQCHIMNLNNMHSSEHISNKQVDCEQQHDLTQL